MANSKVPPYQLGAVQVPVDTFAGQRTFAGPVQFNEPVTQNKQQVVASASLAATGSTQGDAAAIGGTTPLIVSTAGDGTKGIILPVPAGAGVKIEIYNSASGTLKVYPASGGTINSGSANAAVSVVTHATLRLTSTSATNWAG